MPLYRYKAVNGAGATVHGEFDAPGESLVVDWLRDSALMPLKIEIAKGASAAAGTATMRTSGRSWFRRRQVSQEQLLDITREMATLLKAGLPLDRAMEILINLSSADAPKALLQRVRDQVRGGSSLSQALEKENQTGIFSRFYINIVRAGEVGGALAVVMARLAEFMERAKELKETVRSAMIYPTLLLIVAFSSIMLLLTYVVPQFETI